MNKKRLNYDILISGAGIVGSALVCLLAKKTPYRIGLINPQTNTSNKPNTDMSTRVSAITLASEQLFKEIGIWENINTKTPYTATKVWDNTAPASLSFQENSQKSSQNNASCAPHLGHIIENNCMLDALHQKIQQTNIAVIEDKLQDLHTIKNGYQVVLSNQKTITADLLIGADGANSLVAKLSNIQTQQYNYAQKGIVALIKSKVSFNSSIYQWFDAQGIVAILPISDTVCSIVWSCNNDKANELLALNEVDFCTQLSQVIQYHFGQLSLKSTPQAFNLIQKHAKQYVKPNLALVGDAAHSIHPLAGQGVNLGLLDVACLAKQLSTANKSANNLRYLARYESIRKPHNQLMSTTMSAFYHLNQTQNSIIGPIVGIGMNFIDNTPALKQQLQSFVS